MWKPCGQRKDIKISRHQDNKEHTFHFSLFFLRFFNLDPILSSCALGALLVSATRYDAQTGSAGSGGSIQWPGIRLQQAPHTLQWTAHLPTVTCSLQYSFSRFILSIPTNTHTCP